MKVQDLFEAKDQSIPIPDFESWKESRRGQRVVSSYDVFQQENPDAKWYYIVLMDPNTKFSHLDGRGALFATNDPGEAEILASNYFEKTGKDVGLYMPSNGGYAGRYRKQSHDGQPRAKNGRFGQRPKKEQA